MDSNGEQGPKAKTVSRHIKLDQEPRLELQVQQGGILSLEYRSAASMDDEERSQQQEKMSVVQNLRQTILKNLKYVEENHADFETLVWIDLRISRSTLEGRGDKCLALLGQYIWPDREEEGLRELLNHTKKWLRELGVPE